MMMKATRDFMRKLEAASKISNEFFAEKGNDEVVVAVPSNSSIILKIKFEEEFENDVKIYNIGDFMSFIRIFDEPDIEFGKDYAVIKGNGRFSRFMYSSLVSGVNVWREKSEFDVYGHCVLKKEDMEDISKHHRIAMTENVVFEVDMEGSRVISATYNNGYKTENVMKIDVEGESKKKVRVVFSDKNFFSIQPRDYVVTFAQSRKRPDVHLAYFENDELTYIVVASEAEEG